MSGTRTTKVVHCKRAPFDIYIGRPSKWGNPFVIGRDGNREQVIEHVMKQLVVELKADTIRILDRSSNGERDAAEPQTAEAQEEAH